MIYQRTLLKTISVMGIGLHTGKKVTLTLHPAQADTGIVFRRTDLLEAPPLKADVLSVGTTENATTIGQGPFAIHTVEHLLAAFYGLGIDNVYCELSGPEVPIMDGSSAPFVFLLKESGIVNLDRVKKFLVVRKAVSVEVDDKWAQLSPAHNLVIDSTIIFAHPLIKKQHKVFDFSCESFMAEISRARTFGLLRDVDYLKQKGLIKGGSLDNAIILDDYKILNPEGLRMPDELVRHKILDTLGDVSLLGHQIVGKITTYKSGHNLHNKLCRKLLETSDAFEIVAASVLEKEMTSPLYLPLAYQTPY